MSRTFLRSDDGYPGTWVLREGWSAPVICCPLCTRTHLLDHARYSVSGEGEVTPTWQCPSDRCAFYDDLMLDGWHGGGSGSVREATGPSRSAPSQSADVVEPPPAADDEVALHGPGVAAERQRQRSRTR